jgi:hypothetical protein
MRDPDSDSGRAAPPDDGGHQGSYTLPQDEMEAHAADRPPANPPLHRDLDRVGESGRGASPLWMLLWALALIGVSAFFLLSRSCAAPG